MTAVTPIIRANASVISSMHGCPAYVFQKISGDIIIKIVNIAETWLEREPLTLLETVSTGPAPDQTQETK